MHDPDPDDDPDDTPEATAVLAAVDRLSGGACRDCGRAYCGHEAVMSLALGFKDAPRCLPCLAAGLRRDPAELREHVTQYVRRKDCFSQGWQRASDREESPPGFDVPCLAERTPAAASGSAPRPDTPLPLHSPDHWDAGDMGCGDLVLALRIRLNARPPGSVLTLTARDPAAPVDLPAWCGLTGHTLLRADHPTYRIRRKET